jgi:hypothetical protein
MAGFIYTMAILNKLQRSSVMKQNKLLILSLLASFLLLISASYATAQNAVTFGTVNDCPKPAGQKVYVPVMVENAAELAAMDIVGQVVTIADVQLIVTGVTFDERMAFSEILDARFGIGDLGLGDGSFRLGAVKLDELGLAAGSGQVATLELEYVSDCLLGTASLDAFTVDCNGGTKATVFADAAAALIQPTVTSGAVNVVNTAPFFTFCPDDYVIYWGDNVSVTVVADDEDLACGCDALSFTKTSGPGTINSSTGLYQFVALPGDVGCKHVVIEVEDEFGGVAVCEFDIDVLNHPPVITCPDEVINILWGQTVVAPVTAIDPDGGPSAMTFELLDAGAYPGSPAVDPSTGEFTWVTDETNAFLGMWEFCVKVNDGANLDECNLFNADTCCFTVHVDPKFRVTIEKTHATLQGHYAEVEVTMDPTYASMNMGGFDFLIAYDAPGLTFVEATPGQLLVDCGWEYFTYRYGVTGNCGDACPSGLLRIVALAETNNGPNHPTCFNTGSGIQLAKLKFFVSNDRTFECMYLPIRFFWMDCTDNTIASQFGDTLFLVDRVFDFEGNEITDYAEFPNYTGAPDDPCMLGDKEFPLRAIDFKDGGVDVVCSDSIDARGDINVNGLANEIADAVMFTNYFINGLSAFTGHVEASIAASDVNADGLTLSVADLVYLVRVIQGDASPYPKVDPASESIAIRTQQIGQQMTVGYTAENTVGAVLLRFEFNGEVGTPVLGNGAANMDLKYSVNGNELNVLVYNIGQESIAAGENVLVTIPTTGDMHLTEVDAADFYGNVLGYTAHILPSKFDLAQNYPNPFNPTTTINLALPTASDYTVAIYNIAGQLIRTYDGNASAGVVSIVWDGKDASGSQVASGMYFYKAKAGNFSATKKMLLMK